MLYSTHQPLCKFQLNNSNRCRSSDLNISWSKAGVFLKPVWMLPFRETLNKGNTQPRSFIYDIFGICVNFREGNVELFASFLFAENCVFLAVQ